MIPVELQSTRLLLDQLVSSDAELVMEYCRDPLFELYMTTPWPYERQHAEQFIGEYAPAGWRSASEYTWAIRRAGSGEFLGVIGYREATRDLGYWLGAPHRGTGIMTEAVNVVLDWLFGQGKRTVAWECIPGNLASASVARKTGFTYTGTGPSALTSRDGTTATSWHASLESSDSREPRSGWPLP